MKYIEILDDKADCTLCYFDGAILPHEQIPTSTGLYSWHWSPHLENLDSHIEVGSLYRSKVRFEQCERYREAQEEFEAHLRAIDTARVEGSVCRFDLIPEHIYLNLCSAKGSVVEKIIEEDPRPKNYGHLLKAEKLVCEIAQREVQLKLENVTSAKQVKIIKDRTHRIKYNINGSVTGRLTTKKDSFPILTLSRQHRAFIVPTNDLLVEMDFNAAELRVLLALSGQEQPSVDAHEWNRINVCRDLTTRQEAKERFFAWLYNPDSSDFMLKRFYNKSVYKEYYEDLQILTPFDRIIEVDDRKALNYLVQSTSSDLNIEQVYKIREKLIGKKTFIKALLHDSVILDVSKEDVSLLKDLYFIFQETRFGKFKVNVKTGKDFYNMKELKWKT